MRSKEQHYIELPLGLVIGGIGLVRCLGEENIPFYTGSDIGENPSLYSRYSNRKLYFSNYHQTNFTKELCAVGQSLNSKLVFFSDDDRALLTFSKHRSELLPYFLFNLPDHQLVEDMLDKSKFADLAQRLDLPVPLTVVPKNFEELEQATNKISFPCLLKPAHREDWWHPDFIKIIGHYRKVIYCKNRNELLELYRKVRQINSNVLVQEVISGSDSQMSNIDMYINKNLELRAYYIYHKHRTYPVHAGIGCFVETINDDELLNTSISIVKKMKMRGFCNIQFKRDSKTGKLKILEIHPRASIWNYLGKISGLNLILLGYYDILGMDYPFSKQYQTGIKSMDIKRDLKALPAYLKNGEWTLFSWLKSLKGTKSLHLFSFKDPFPFIVDVWFVIKKQLKIRGIQRRNFSMKKIVTSDLSTISNVRKIS